MCRDYAEICRGVVTGRSRAEQGEFLAGQWGVARVEEGKLDAEEGLEAVLECLMGFDGLTVAVVTENAVQNWAVSHGYEGSRPWAVLEVMETGNFSVRSQEEAFPHLRLRDTLKNVAEQIADRLKGPKSSIGSSISSKAPPKEVSSLSQAADDFRQRVITAIDRAHDQTEDHLKKLENSIYKKAQDRLQRLDDCSETLKPISSGLDTVQKSLEKPASHVALRKRLDDLNHLLERCQSELEELERTKYACEDDYDKTLPLHILKDVIITDGIIHLKVVNLKSGTYENVQLEVKDEVGQVEMEVKPLSPGLQTIQLRVNTDLYLVKRMEMRLKVRDKAISNTMVIEMEDEQPKSPIKATPMPVDDFDSTEPVPVLDSEMTPAELDKFTSLEDFLGADFMQSQREHFLHLIRNSPYGDKTDIQMLGAMLTDRMSG